MGEENTLAPNAKGEKSGDPEAEPGEPEVTNVKILEKGMECDCHVSVSHQSHVSHLSSFPL